MRTNPAFANLVSNPGKALVSIAGIGFAVLLIFMQLGFLGSVGNTATVVYDKLDYDIMVRSPDYLHFVEARTIPRSLLPEIASRNEVASIRPFSVAVSVWLTPKNRHQEKQDFRVIALIGVDPAQPVFTLEEINEKAKLLTSDEAVLIDRFTKSDFGPQDGRRFGDLDVQRNVQTELASNMIQIVGHFGLGTGLAANGSGIVNESAFSKMTQFDANKEVTFGLVKLREGVDPELFRARLATYYDKQFPNGSPVEILTPGQVSAREKERWISRTPIGMIFMMGVVVAIIVGATIVYMVLSSDIAKRMQELATLKAMGYTDRYLSGLVIQQALFLAIAAFIPALLAGLVLYQLTYVLSNIPITMPISRVLFVFVLTIAMCAVSGILAQRKVIQAEPASLF